VVSRTEQEYEPPYHYSLCLVSCFRHRIPARNIAKYEAGHNARITPTTWTHLNLTRSLTLSTRGLVNVENVSDLVSSAQVHTPAKQHSNESQSSV